MNCLSSLLLVSTSAAFQISRRLSGPHRLDRGFHLSRQLPRPRQSPSPALSASFTPSFCEVCGSSMEKKIPPGDERERSVCTSCGHISYQNPKVVVGTICTFGEKVLLCKRAIEPCKDKWGYPQGFMENGETTRQGAARECLCVSPAARVFVAHCSNSILLTRILETIQRRGWRVV